MLDTSESDADDEGDDGSSWESDQEGEKLKRGSIANSEGGDGRSDQRERTKEKPQVSQECSQEVANLIRVLTNNIWLIRGVFCTRGRREGLMGGKNATDKLKKLSTEKERRVEWATKRLTEAQSAFVKVLQVSDNPCHFTTTIRAHRRDGVKLTKF